MRIQITRSPVPESRNLRPEHGESLVRKETINGFCIL